MSVNNAHTHVFMHNGLSHVEERKCVNGIVNESDGVGMLRHLWCLCKSHSQTPLGFGLRVIPHYPTHTHMAGASQHNVPCDTMCTSFF